MSNDSTQQREVHGIRKGSGTINWFHRSPARSNQHCLYCARFIGEESPLPSDKEHLIARRMVPLGGFSEANAFNFIFRACRECNEEKATLEDHISAVTLLTSPGRLEETVDAEARRKAAKSFDPRHRKPIGAVRNTMKVEMGGVFTFELVAPAQLDRGMACLLALRHIQGLFALTTTESPLRSETMRLLPGDHFGVFNLYPHRDWGNPELLEIACRARKLPEIANVVTASGYFQSVLRRDTAPGSPWFWALEWNKSLRLVGWIGDAEECPPIFKDLPDANWQAIRHEDGGMTRFRQEVLLDETEDILFEYAVI